MKRFSKFETISRKWLKLVKNKKWFLKKTVFLIDIWAVLRSGVYVHKRSFWKVFLNRHLEFYLWKKKISYNLTQEIFMIIFVVDFWNSISQKWLKLVYDYKWFQRKCLFKFIFEHFSKMTSTSTIDVFKSTFGIRFLKKSYCLPQEIFMRCFTLPMLGLPFLTETAEVSGLRDYAWISHKLLEYENKTFQDYSMVGSVNYKNKTHYSWQIVDKYILIRI